MADIELARAYVEIIPVTKGISRKTQEEIFPGRAPAEDAAKKSGRAFTDRLGGVLKKTAIGVGVAAGGVLATSLVKGFGRLSAIETAEAKLRGLGNSATDVASIMDNALGAVKGTAFGMDEAATTAASAVAAGIKPGKELESYLRLVGDAATIAGTDMGDMGAIFNKVATSGKVQGDVFAQLGDKGIPIVSLLADQMGVSAAEVYKLGSAGKISSEQFLSAMSSMSGAALEGGKTTTGAFKNMGAALSRLGASLLSGVYPLIGPLFNAITDVLDQATSAVGPFIERITPGLQAAAAAVLGWVTTLTESAGGIAQVISTGVFDPSQWAEGVGADSPLVAAAYAIRDAWTTVRDVMGPILGMIRDGIASAVPYVRELWGWFGELSTSAKAVFGGSVIVGGLAAFGKLGSTLGVLGKKLQPVMGLFSRLTPVLRVLGGPVGLLVSGLVVLIATNEDVRASFGELLDVLGGAIGSTLETLVPIVADLAVAMGPVLAAAAKAFGVALEVIAPVVVLVADGLAALIGWLEPALPALVAVTGAIMLGVKAWGLYQATMAIASAMGTGFLGVIKAMTLGLARQRIATVASAVAQKAQIVWTKAAAAAQWLLNAAMTANPIGLIIAGIVALGAALWLFFTKTETGRKLWAKIWGGIKAAVDAVVTWITDTAWPALQAAWDAIATGALWLWNSAIAPAWDGIKAAVGAVGDWMTGTLWPAIQTAWQGIATAALWLWNSVITPVWQGIKTAIAIAVTAVGLYIDLLKWYFEKVIAPVALWLWNNVMKPAWNGIKAVIGFVVAAIGAYIDLLKWYFQKVIAPVALWLWNSIMKPAWNGIRSAISAVVSWLTGTAWPLIKKVWDAIASSATFLWRGVIVPVWNGIRAAISAVVSWLRDTAWAIVSKVIGWLRQSFEGWRLIAEAVWRGVRAAISVVVLWFRDTAWPIVSRVIGWIKTGFNTMRDGVKAAWNYVKDKVIAPVAAWFRDTIGPLFKKATDGIADAFTTLRDAVKRSWEKIRDSAKKPVEFVVETIIRDGIVKKFNEVAKTFGVKTIDPDKFTVGWARGGYTGPGAKYRPAGVVHADEFVIRKESQNSLRNHAPGFLDALNRYGARALGYAGGGKVLRGWRQIADIPHAGMTITSTVRQGARTAGTGSVSKHAQGLAVDFAGAASAMKSFFNFVRNNYSVSELIHTPMGGRQLSRGGVPRAKFPSATARSHYNHVHVGGWGRGEKVKAAAGGGFDLNPFDGLWDSLRSKTRKGVGSTPFGDLLFKLPQKLIGGAVDWAKEKLEAAADWAGDKVGGAVGRARWTPTAMRALAMEGESGPRNLNSLLNRMGKESGYNPRAINNWDSNARKGTPSKGLMQVIDPTFRAYARPGYGKDIWDPLSNILASIRYTRSRYGSLTRGWNRAGGYWDGGLVASLFDKGGWMNPGDIGVNLGDRPEPVFTGAQWDLLAQGFAERSTGGRDGDVIVQVEHRAEDDPSVFGRRIGEALELELLSVDLEGV